jgi:hypothetical protein
VIYVVVPR